MRSVGRGNRNRIIPVIVGCGFLLLVWQVFAGGEGQGETGESGLFSRLLQTGGERSLRNLLPVLSEQEAGQAGMILQEEPLEEWMPGYLYQTRAGQVAVRQEGGQSSEFPEEEGQQGRELSLEELMRQENQGRLEDQGEQEVTVLDLESLLEENGWDAQTLPEEPLQENVPPIPQETGDQDGAVVRREFVPHILQQTVDLSALTDYETLRNQFYAVDSVTTIGKDLLDVQKLTQRDLTISKEDPGPQILIYHTHSQEGFVDSVQGDQRTTIMGVGGHLAEILEQRYGYQVLHHEGTYDVPTRDDAYSRSLPEITRLLEENPQIQVVIDLHRDAVADDTHLVMDLDGRPTARFMFFNGISWTRRTGSISYLQNDNLSDNLAFSFQMKLKAEEYYPGLTRRNYINGYRYNMHLRPRTLLIELGAQNNTLEEAMNACDPIAHLLDMVLSGGEN